MSAHDYIISRLHLNWHWLRQNQHITLHNLKQLVKSNLHLLLHPCHISLKAHWTVLDVELLLLAAVFLWFINKLANQFSGFVVIS